MTWLATPQATALATGPYVGCLCLISHGKYKDIEEMADKYNVNINGL